jgi:hypothetical protein
MRGWIMLLYEHGNAGQTEVDKGDVRWHILILSSSSGQHAPPGVYIYISIYPPLKAPSLSPYPVLRENLGKKQGM